MDVLSDKSASVDLLWSEGAGYMFGLERAVALWRPLLAHGGRAAVSECSWLTSSPPEEAAAFFAGGYPAMGTVEEDVARAKRARAGATIFLRVYEEGASAAAVRPAFQRMMADARQRRFDVLVIWAIDRFGRSFVYDILDVADLDRLGVLVVSVKDSWLNTTSGVVRQVLVGIFSAMAEHERERHKKRVRAGRERAREGNPSAAVRGAHR